MKAIVIPAHKYGGTQCYTFADSYLREAFKTLTGQTSASKKKLDALIAFGVRIEIPNNHSSTSIPPTHDAVQKSD